MSCGVLDAFDNMELKQGRRLQAKHHLKMRLGAFEIIFRFKIV